MSFEAHMQEKVTRIDELHALVPPLLDRSTRSRTPCSQETVLRARLTGFPLHTASPLDDHPGPFYT